MGPRPQTNQYISPGATGVIVSAADARALWPGHRVGVAVVSGITQSPTSQISASRAAGPDQTPKCPGRALGAGTVSARSHP